jgi:hypothetical protein
MQLLCPLVACSKQRKCCRAIAFRFVVLFFHRLKHICSQLRLEPSENMSAYSGELYLKLRIAPIPQNQCTSPLSIPSVALSTM